MWPQFFPKPAAIAEAAADTASTRRESEQAITESEPGPRRRRGGRQQRLSPNSIQQQPRLRPVTFAEKIYNGHAPALSPAPAPVIARPETDYRFEPRLPSVPAVRSVQVTRAT